MIHLMKKAFAFAMLIVLFLAVLRVAPPVMAQSTLAETLNARINNISWTPGNISPPVQGAQYGIIFGKFDTSAYDAVAQSLLSSSDWLDLIRLKRAAEVSGYDSATLDNALRQALENIPMVGSLPVTYTQGPSNGSCFLVYYGFTMYGYKYAEQMGISRWDKQAAFQQLANLVDKYGGGFLMAYQTSADYADQPNTRYYDEQAEVLRALEILYEIGVNGAKAYADKIWNHLLNDGWWYPQGGWFWYRPAWRCWEVEMGGFACIISGYLGSPPPQVISDINQKLLQNGWQSYGWMNRYVLNHAETPTGSFVTNEMRPWETISAWHALQALYPSMTPSMQTNMVNMLSQNGWQLALNSGSFDGSTDRQLAGLMVAFLMGIIPSSASLDTGYDEECYATAGNDIEFPSNKYLFDYTGHQIRIPVKGPGELKFIFSTNIATANFPGTGVFDVTFSNDWSTVIDVREAGSGPNPQPQPQPPTGNWSDPIVFMATVAVIIVGIVLGAKRLQHKRARARKRKGCERRKPSPNHA